MSAPVAANYFIGLMSGTSMDGVDAVLAHVGAQSCRVLAHHKEDFPASLKEEFLALSSPTENELHRVALAANALANMYAHGVAELLCSASLDSTQIVAIGAHGQTVRHRPDLGYTWQLNNPARLAALTGIDVVADFRSGDIASGGQGAPLVVAFHQSVFGQSGAKTAIVNIGGIANISLLGEGPVRGFDTGPGNMLMDAWTQLHKAQAFDGEGTWAAQGTVVQPLLEQALSTPYFSLPPPKSTGRELFDLQWLQAQMHLAALEHNTLQAQDVQATLLEITARSIATCVPADYGALYVCGGGAHNTYLMQRLQQLIPSVAVLSTAALGIAPTHVEACAFAWLAARCVAGSQLSMQTITGASSPRTYGALYRA